MLDSFTLRSFTFLFLFCFVCDDTHENRVHAMVIYSAPAHTHTQKEY